MSLRKPLSALAIALTVAVLAPLGHGAHAHTNVPADEEDFSSIRIMSTGPMNIVVFRVSGR